MKKLSGIILALSVIVSVPNLIPGYAEAGENISVGVFDFETKEAGIDKLGPQIADMVTAYLSTDPNLQVVERAEIKKILSELGLSKTGIVEQDQAVQVGRVIGAKILVTGRAFPIDGELVIVSKIIGTETTRVFGNVVKGPLSEKLTTLIEEMATKIAKTIEDKGGELLPAPQAEEDLLLILREKLEGKKLPRVSVEIYDEYIGVSDIDSAAKREIIFILRECGFVVVQQSREVLSAWARSYLEDSSIELPQHLERVDVILVGEAFSEFAARTGSLVSSKARVELRAIDISSGRILASSRKTETAVDLSERIAARTALQNATLDVAFKLIPEMLDSWQQ